MIVSKIFCNRNNDPSLNLVKVSHKQAIDFSIIDRRFSVVICHVVGVVVDVDILVLMVTVDTEKLAINVPSASAVGTNLNPDVITKGAETISEKSNGNLLLFYFLDMIS